MNVACVQMNLATNKSTQKWIHVSEVLRKIEVLKILRTKFSGFSEFL
jgi:hypothetical protein